MNKILAIREQFNHMSKHCGYDVLYSFLDGSFDVDSIQCSFHKKYIRGIGRLLTIGAKLTNNTSFYNAQSFDIEIRVLLKYLLKQYNLVHYTYGEPYFSLGKAIKVCSKSSLIITNHQPTSWWQKNTTLFKSYKSCDLVIALSEHDKEYFNSYIPNKAICIPHGVDIDFFKPIVKDTVKNTFFRVVFSGRYLRDTKTLAAVIKNLTSMFHFICFDVIYLEKSLVNEQHLKEIMVNPKVIWHSNITEEELLKIYQNADCSLIPLIDCTANNAILESLSCGLPIVTTNLPAINTYLDSSHSILGRKGNVDDLCDAIIYLYKNPLVVEEMGRSARNKAIDKFDWVKISEQTSKYFKILNA